MTQRNLQNRNRLTDLENESMAAGGKDGGVVMEFGVDMYTLLYLKWVINKDLLYGTGNTVQCYVLITTNSWEKNLKKNIYMYIYIYI